MYVKDPEITDKDAISVVPVKDIRFTPWGHFDHEVWSLLPTGWPTQTAQGPPAGHAAGANGFPLNCLGDRDARKRISGRR